MAVTVRYTRRQWLTLIVFSFAQFCNAVCVSLQAPFYPHEAELKGATATQYGFVFGVFELVVFLVSPVYGKYLNVIGVKFMNNTGIFTVSITSILFGILDRVNDPDVFIGLSFAVRIFEALGNAAFVTSAFSIIAIEFPKSVGSAFAIMETFFGLGLIAGPTVGGALYQVGGYELPFLVLGGVLFFSAMTTCIVLPKPRTTDAALSLGTTGRFLEALRLPPIIHATMAIVCTSISIGFLQATLEPHLRQLNLSPLQVGLMFVLNGATYAFSAPCWGWLCDRYFAPRLVTLAGACIAVMSFLLIGPAPFFMVELTIPIAICALLMHGLGMGALLVSTFTGAHRDVVARGFPDDIHTYGVVSGIWTSSFAFGCFVGPSIGGVLLDTIGFQWASMLVMGLLVLVAVSLAIYTCHGHRSQISRDEQAFSSTTLLQDETTPLLRNAPGQRPVRHATPRPDGNSSSPYNSGGSSTDAPVEPSTLCM